MAARHAAAIQRAVAGARVVAFADLDMRAQEAFQQPCPEAKPYSSLTVLLESKSIDTIHIRTPPAAYENLAIEALEAGCHNYETTTNRQLADQMLASGADPAGKRAS